MGVQDKLEHQKTVNTGFEDQNIGVRDSPSLVWGRPAKSVVERPRGFNSHIPRHFSYMLSCWKCCRYYFWDRKVVISIPLRALIVFSVNYSLSEEP